jgi:hypothetical protein
MDKVRAHYLEIQLSSDLIRCLDEKVLRRSGGSLMMDATHDTCVHDHHKGRSKRQLYTLMVRDAETRAGCPVDGP